MGLSRNKVAVPEGAAGTPPFWKQGVRSEDEILSLTYNKEWYRQVTNSCLLANKFISLYIVREKVEQATLAVQVCASLLSSLKRESTIFDILYNNSTSKFRISKVNTLE